MTSNRPYLIRAIHQWICDNGLTTHLVVDAGYPGAEVPQEFVRDGQIVLNISPSAVQALQVNNDLLSFSARFGGRPTDVFVPVSAVMGIYARENGQGMVFDAVDVVAGSEGKRGQLTDTNLKKGADNPLDKGTDRGLKGGAGDAATDDNNSPDKPPRGGKRPNLRIVK